MRDRDESRKGSVGRDRRRLPRRRAKPRAGATSTTSKLGKENSVEVKKREKKKTYETSAVITTRGRTAPSPLLPDAVNKNISFRNSVKTWFGRIQQKGSNKIKTTKNLKGIEN